MLYKWITNPKKFWHEFKIEANDPERSTYSEAHLSEYLCEQKSGVVVFYK